MIGFFYSVTIIVATKATLLYNLQSIFIAVLAVVFLKETLNVVDYVTLIGAFVGVAIISAREDTENVSSSYFLQLVGIFLCILESFAHSAMIIIIKQMNKHLHYLFSPFYFALS